MIPKYINDWLTIIEQMSNDNTYKLAWGRAILECINYDNYIVENNEVVVSFNNISECMLKYYWNQMFFFNLKQAPYKNTEPVICKHTTEVINKYKEIKNTEYPEWFDKGIIVVKEKDIKFYNNVVSKISKVLHENVSYRFKNTPNGVLEIYNYTKQQGPFIKISLEKKEYLKEYFIILSELLNYKWTQLLEKFNYQPKIASKVKGISDSKIRRSNLLKYRDVLFEAFDNGKIIDFYTDEEISNNDVSIDHVIPWSYMYSDDIWNLVVTTKSNNSSKSNSIPDEKYIEKLKQRNDKLVNIVADSFMKQDLQLAIENGFVDKFYHACRM